MMGMLDPIRTRVRHYRERARRREEVSRFWDSHHGGSSLYWAEVPRIREHVNRLITEVQWLFPLTALKITWAYRTLPRGLSIGCGSGVLERNARMLGICERIDAYDVSRESIREARRLARKEKLDGIRYRVADCDRIELPRNKYDIAFFHGSLHHIADPERMLAQVRRSLKPHGLLFLDDYVGPSRDEWTDEHLIHAREAYEEIPEELRVLPVNRPVDWDDPSEMIASSRILPAVRSHFEILQEKPYWGNLLFPLFCAVDGKRLSAAEHVPLVDRLISREIELVRDGTFQDPLFTVLVARTRG